jgi:hypothetical protein
MENGITEEETALEFYRYFISAINTDGVNHLKVRKVDNEIEVEVVLEQYVLRSIIK